MQTEEAKHETNKNTGSGESLGDKASHVGNVASNKVRIDVAYNWLSKLFPKTICWGCAVFCDSADDFRVFAGI